MIGALLMSTGRPALAAARPGPQSPPDPFIEALLRKMSLEEKAAQLSLIRSPISTDKLNPEGKRIFARDDAKEDVRKGLAGGYFNGFHLDFNRELQRIAVEESRLRIPLIFAADVIHGLKTTYPIPLGEAASFDPELAERTARLAAVEATALGLQWTFGPDVDIARDERWGRVMEGAGEDVWLSAQLSAARVRGFQGHDLRAADSLLACPKHFAGYGAVQGGMDYNTAELAETTLRQTHLPPFKAGFDAGALSTMAAFNDIAGVPCTGNRRLLTDILRGEWNFRGLVVSDFDSVLELVVHGFAADEEDAVVKALTAGCDVALSSIDSDVYRRAIPKLVRAGRLPLGVVDESVRRVLRVKKALGLFENPYRSLDPSRAAVNVRRPDMVALAREAARKSLVLLKNDGGLLPLPKSGKKIAFIGPFLFDKKNELGSWSVTPDVLKVVTLEAAVRDALGPDAAVTFTRGCEAEEAIPGGLDEARNAASAADIVVLYLGELARKSGESASTISITIPAVQQALAEALAALGKPTVVVLKHGRALELAGAVRNAPALLCSWFLGSESGHALADVIFGDFAPQGRLPVSFPQASGQQPFHYDRRSTGRPQVDAATAFKARYDEVANAPLYPFGYGLTFSRVDYGPTQVSGPKFSRDGVLKVSALLRNVGERAAHEVAQLYIHQRVAAITQPLRRLRAIRHVDLAPGAEALVEFTLRAGDLASIHPDLSDRADAGVFDVWVAPSAEAGEKASFTLA